MQQGGGGQGNFGQGGNAAGNPNNTGSPNVNMGGQGGPGNQMVSRFLCFLHLFHKVVYQLFLNSILSNSALFQRTKPIKLVFAAPLLFVFCLVGCFLFGWLFFSPEIILLEIWICVVL